MKYHEIASERRLNFTPCEVPLITETAQSISTHKAICRSDNGTVLSVVGKKYQPTNYNDTLGISDIIAENSSFDIKELSSMADGTKAILTMENNGIDINGEDHKARIVLIDGVDGKTSFIGKAMVYRLVCSNGLMAYANESTFKFKHTLNIDNKISEALRIISQSESFINHFKVTAERLQEVRADRKMVEKFLDSFVGESGVNTKTDNRRIEIDMLINEGAGNNGSSAWDIYNGYTEYLDRKFEDKTEELIYGRYGKQKENAFSYLESMVA